MKAYIHPNLDGTRQTMVAAHTLKEAARKLGTSERDMRVMGWRYAKNEDLDLACASPEWVFTKPVSESGGVWLKWRRPYFSALLKRRAAWLAASRGGSR